MAHTVTQEYHVDLLRDTKKRVSKLQTGARPQRAWGDDEDIRKRLIEKVKLNQKSISSNNAGLVKPNEGNSKFFKNGNKFSTSQSEISAKASKSMSRSPNLLKSKSASDVSAVNRSQTMNAEAKKKALEKISNSSVKLKKDVLSSKKSHLNSQQESQKKKKFQQRPVAANAVPTLSFSELLKLADQNKNKSVVEDKPAAEVKNSGSPRPLTQEEKDRKAHINTKEYQDWLKFGSRKKADAAKITGSVSASKNDDVRKVTNVDKKLHASSDLTAKAASVPIKNEKGLLQKSPSSGGKRSASNRTNKAQDVCLGPSRKCPKLGDERSVSENASDEVRKTEMSASQKCPSSSNKSKVGFNKTDHVQNARLAASQKSHNSTDKRSVSQNRPDKVQDSQLVASQKRPSSGERQNILAKVQDKKREDHSVERKNSATKTSTQNLPRKTVRNSELASKQRPLHSGMDKPDGAARENSTLLVCKPAGKKLEASNPWDRIYGQLQAKNPVKRKSQPSYSDEDDSEYDSDDDDFICDDPIGDESANDFSSHIRDIFGYDKRKYQHERDEDIRGMETSFRDQMKEEAYSSKEGKREDLEDMMKELEEMKARKMKKAKKFKS